MIDDQDDSFKSTESIRKRKYKGRSFKEVRKHTKQSNKGKAIARRIERRNEIRAIPDDLRKQAFIKYGHVCYICQKNGATTLDHVIPVIKGGLTELKNLRPAHYECNQQKGGTIIILPEELEEVGW